MKKRAFLAPLALSLAALINPASGSAATQALGTPAQAVASAGPTQDTGFVLTPSQQSVAIDTHSAHSSHSSHASHFSHRSHFSRSS
jgi:hypothetical protein